METNQLSLTAPAEQLRPLLYQSRFSDIVARYSVWAAVLLGTFLLPLQSRIWNGPGGPPASVLLTQWLAPWLTGDVAASALAQPPLTYFKTGHWFVLVYVGLLLGVVCTRAIPHPWLRWALLLTLSLGGVADVGVYWWGEYLVKTAREFIFWRVELPSLLGSLGLVTLLAFRMRRQPVRSAFSTLLPYSIVPIALGLTAVFEYIPHGPMLSVALTLAALVNRSVVVPDYAGRPIIITGIVVGAVLTLMLLLSTLAHYQPRRVAGPVIRSIAPIPYQTKTGLRLHVFNTGYNRMSRALAPGNPIWRPAPAFVIEHPRAGLIVFDGGLSPAVAERGESALPFPMSVLFESRGAPNQTLERQMSRAGLNPTAVRFVVLSHLHEDHLGNLGAFPNARIVLSERADSTKLPAHTQRVLRAEAGTPTASGLGTLYDLLNDGTIRLIQGGGHAPEDLMAWVNLDGGPVLLAGDAVVHWDWLRSDDVERVSTDGARAAEVRNQLRALLVAQPQLILFPGHDTSRMPRHRPDVLVKNPPLFRQKAWASRLSLPMKLSKVMA